MSVGSSPTRGASFFLKQISRSSGSSIEIDWYARLDSFRTNSRVVNLFLYQQFLISQLVYQGYIAYIEKQNSLPLFLLEYPLGIFSCWIYNLWGN